MLTGAIDVGFARVRMVLIDPGVPEMLSSHCLSRKAEDLVTQVLCQLDLWEEISGRAMVSLVGCRHDPWPPALLTAVSQSGRPVRWLNRGDILGLLATWERWRPDPQWLRASLMVYWSDASATCSRGGTCPRARLDAIDRLIEERGLDLLGETTFLDIPLCAAHRGPAREAGGDDLPPDQVRKRRGRRESLPQAGLRGSRPSPMTSRPRGPSSPGQGCGDRGPSWTPEDFDGGLGKVAEAQVAS